MTPADVTAPALLTIAVSLALMLWGVNGILTGHTTEAIRAVLVVGEDVRRAT